MTYDANSHTFDCTPTFNDREVLEFCKTGFLLLEGIIDEDTNTKTRAFLAGEIEPSPTRIPQGLTLADLASMAISPHPSSIIFEEWFMAGMLLNKRLIGVIRSLLGANVGLPVRVANHRVECPDKALSWHHDSGHVYGPEVNYVEVFYFPQDTPVELGPTEVIPGSHIRRAMVQPDERGLTCAGQAGTVGVHMTSIQHRRPASTAIGTRHMVKFLYWRTSAPSRDWLVDPDFDFHTADYGGHLNARYFAHMFYWLCGKGDDFRVIGGQGWPWSTPNQIGPSYGFEAEDGYIPAWRQNHDGYAL